MALEIIGPGFGRTGTNSLQLALEQLGYEPCHHMHEIGAHPELLPAWDAVSLGGAPDWDQMFAGYRAQVDWPGARFWRDLATHFPQAKVVLSVRDPDEWFDSVQKTIAPFLAGRGTHPDPHGNAIAHMAHRLIAEDVFDGGISDRARATHRFRQHIDEVEDTIAPERLLVFNVAEGWEPLCAFLGKPVPDGPFPHLNTTRQFNDPEWKGR